MFTVLDVLAVKWATGDLPEECRFLLDTQLIFLKKAKTETTKMLDDEWIRSVTSAETIATDIRRAGNPRHARRHLEGSASGPRKSAAYSGVRIRAQVRVKAAPGTQ